MSPSFAAGLLLILASVWAMPARAADLSLAEKIDILVKAYPDTLRNGSGKDVGFVRHARFLPVDDGVARDHLEMIESGDIEDSLRQIYPAGPCEARPEINFDPGRIRSEPLMKLMYGGSSKEVAAHFGISPRTVDHHRARILEKLGVKSLTEMIALVRPDDFVD